jgi:hypothetical protein
LKGLRSKGNTVHLREDKMVAFTEVQNNKLGTNLCVWEMRKRVSTLFSRKMEKLQNRKEINREVGE